MPDQQKDSDNQSSPPSPDQRREHPSTYFVQDRANIDEMTRLQLQGELLTSSMGGVLPEQSDPNQVERILDVACGTGDWLIAAAKQYPHLKRLTGVDISAKMIDYARSQAEAQGVSDRVEFRAMDALRALEFRANAFDLVNQRFGASFLRKWDWPNILREYQRVCKPGGVIRITEADFIVECSSPALKQLYDLANIAFYQAGHYFSPTSDTIVTELPGLMQTYGVEQVQTVSYTLAFRPGTPEGERFVESMRLVYRTMAPFLRKWAAVPDEYEKIYQQAMTDLEQTEFVVKWGLLTAWGKNSVRNVNKPASRD